MPIVSTDIKYRLSGGAANSDANASLGGAKSSTDQPSGLFDTVSGAESAAGDVEYRCIYIHNAHATLTLLNPVIWIGTNTTGSEIAIGVGTSAINGTEQTVANESTAPTTVSFTQPATQGAGLALTSIPAGQHRAVWLRRTVAAASPARNQTYQLQVAGDTEA